jgi:hypothetical protein
MKPIDKAALAALALALVCWGNFSLSFADWQAFAASFLRFATANALCAAALVLGIAVCEKYRKLPAHGVACASVAAVLLFAPMALVGLVTAAIPVMIVAGVAAVGYAGQAIARH